MTSKIQRHQLISDLRLPIADLKSKIVNHNSITFNALSFKIINRKSAIGIYFTLIELLVVIAIIEWTIGMDETFHSSSLVIPCNSGGNAVARAQKCEGSGQDNQLCFES
jgi:hypothetical protein